MCARFTPFLHGVIHYFCCDCSRLQSSAFTSFPGGFPFRKWNKPLGTNLLFLRSAAVFFILNVKKSREYVTRVATLVCNLTRTFLEFNETFTKIRFNRNRCYLLHMRLYLPPSIRRPRDQRNHKYRKLKTTSYLIFFTGIAE